MINLDNVFRGNVERIEFFKQTKNLKVREDREYEDGFNIANQYHSDKAYEDDMTNQKAMINYFMSLNHDG